ncbi:MAG: MATE family efflux transporter [Pseudomonadota bacterium]
MTQPLTYAAHARAIAVLGLPLIGGHLAQMAIGLTDTVMMGWYGVEALAAIGLGSTYFFVFFLMGSGIAWAVMPMVASFAAEGDETSLRRATRMGLWLSTIFAVLVLPLMYWAEPIMLAFQQESGVAADASAYLQVAGLGLIPALLVMVLKSYLSALERTQIVLWITLVAALANALANYALIFGNWGAPELGIIGAALASIITQAVSLLGVIIYCHVVLPEHDIFGRLWKPDWPMFARVAKLGAPIGVTNLSEVGLFTASAFMMGALGTVALAAHTVAVQLASITFMVHLGLSNVATIRAGHAFGARDPDRMATGAKVVTAMSLVMAALTIILFLAAPQFLILLFVNPSDPDLPQIMAIGVGLLAMAALFQLVDGAQVIALGLLRGVQDTGVPMVLAAISYWVIGIPASYLLGFTFGMGGIGIWLGLVIGLACAGVLLMHRFWAVSFRRLSPSVAVG